MRIVKCYFLNVKGANIASSELSIIQFALQEKYQNDRKFRKFWQGVHCFNNSI